MIDWLRREAIYLWYYLDIQVRQIAPYWALGILLGSAVSVFGKRYIHGAFSKIYPRCLPSFITGSDGLPILSASNILR